ncbi:MAG TPA: hypothetical protein VFI02_11825 [Armatimonadota bacterium]|nr:hypothetical protein [Armatimonadota bacterium]
MPRVAQKLSEEDKQRLPKAALRQIEADEQREADELAAEQARRAQETEPEPAPLEPEPPAVPGPEPVPVDHGPDAPPVTGDVQTVPLSDYQKLLDEHRTLKGKYDVEVPRLSYQTRTLEKMLADARSTPTIPTEPEVPAHLRNLTKEEREEWAEEQDNVQLRMARGVVETEVDKLRRERATLETRIADLESRNVQAESQNRIMPIWDKIEELSPGAKMIDKEDPGWAEFLGRSDPDSATGATYGETGKALLDLGKAKDVAALIDTYRATTDGVASRVVAQIKPKTTRARVEPEATKVETVKLSEIKRFLDDRHRGRCKKGDGTSMTEAEMNTIQEIFDKAEDEGRINVNR